MNNLLEQLKKINVEPSLEWKEQTRSFLLAEVGRHRVAQRQTGFSAGHFRMMTFAWRPVAALSLVALFFLGSTSFVALAARKAVPGDNLFVVKRAWEKINEYMAVDAARKTELASAVLETRVDDLQKILEQETVLVSAGEKNNESIFVAVDEVKKQIEDVNDKFVAMQEKDKESGKRIVEAALALNERIRGYKQEITLVKEKVENTEANKELDLVLNKVEDINSDVLALLVDKHSSGEVKLEESDLAMRVGDHVKQVEDKLVEVSEAVGSAAEQDSTIKQKVDEVKVAIKKANEALNNNEYRLALTFSKDSNAILELIYGSIYEVKNDSEKEPTTGEVKGVETATTTIEIMAPNVFVPKATTTETEEEPEVYEVNILR
ncbi:hypothetical protein GYA54_01745 [Candidatus Kuenenbacteria bacterium]|nr:hypothetical protein [Candidatus Kuenenbacteria bacterium]